MEPSREIFWNIQFGEILYLLGAIATATFFYAIYRRVRIWRLGSPANRFNHLGRRVWQFIVITVCGRGLSPQVFRGV